MIAVHNDRNTTPCEHCDTVGDTRELWISGAEDQQIRHKLEFCLPCLKLLRTAITTELCRSPD